MAGRSGSAAYNCLPGCTLEFDLAVISNEAAYVVGERIGVAFPHQRHNLRALTGPLHEASHGDVAQELLRDADGFDARLMAGSPRAPTTPKGPASAGPSE
jgi:hypothetical protein